MCVCSLRSLVWFCSLVSDSQRFVFWFVRAIWDWFIFFLSLSLLVKCMHMIISTAVQLSLHTCISNHSTGTHLFLFFSRLFPVSNVYHQREMIHIAFFISNNLNSTNHLYQIVVICFVYVCVCFRSFLLPFSFHWISCGAWHTKNKFQNFNRTQFFFQLILIEIGCLLSNCTRTNTQILLSLFSVSSFYDWLANDFVTLPSTQNMHVCIFSHWRFLCCCPFIQNKKKYRTETPIDCKFSI